MSPVQSALWTVLGVALVISVVTDVLRRRILDIVTYPLMAIALGAPRHIPYGVAIAVGTFWAMWWQQTNSS
jgi:Flp pilus assembly protein protease CpaA